MSGTLFFIDTYIVSPYFTMNSFLLIEMIGHYISDTQKLVRLCLDVL